MRLAAAPTSWGVDFADDPANPPWERVLDDIAASGLDLLELGPVGYLPEDPARLASELERRGLCAVGSFVFQPLHDPAARRDVLEAAGRACRMVAGAGGRVLVVIDLVSEARAVTAGRPDAVPRLRGRSWEGLRDGVCRVAEVACEHGLRPVLHNHAGSYVEQPEELEDLLEAIDPGELGACLDTGHAAYAGADPAGLARRLGPRLEHLHLKDVDPARLAAVTARRGSFWEAVGEGVFCPIGTGMVDFPAVAAALRDTGYGGSATIEQDGDAHQAEHALRDLRTSVAALGRAGFAAPG